MTVEKIIYTAAVSIVPILFAITFHEVAHGWVANKLGDGTARMLGRLSLNPIKHIDPIGTILVPLIAIFSAGLLFGWAKPVPVNTRNFKAPLKDMALVAIAGPVANLLMVVFWLIIIKIVLMVSGPHASGVARGFFEMAWLGIYFNFILFFFNLLPIPPLDGSKVVSGLAPRSVSNFIERMEPYGMYFIIGIIALSYYRIINISPFFDFIKNISLSAVKLM